MLLVPHRRSGGGPLQTARVGLRGGGGGCGWRGGGEGWRVPPTLNGRGKGAICRDKGQLLGSRRTHTAVILCSWPLKHRARACKGGFNAAAPFHSHERTNTDSIHEDDILRRGGRGHTQYDDHPAVRRGNAQLKKKGEKERRVC